MARTVNHPEWAQTRVRVVTADPNTSFDSKWHQTCDDRTRLQPQGFDPVDFAYPFGSDCTGTYRNREGN